MSEGVKGYAVDDQGFDMDFVVSLAAKPFFAQGADHVVAARHCGKVYVGTVKPMRCGTCDTPAEELEILYAKPDENSPHGILLTSKEPS